MKYFLLAVLLGAVVFLAVKCWRSLTLEQRRNFKQYVVISLIYVFLFICAVLAVITMVWVIGAVVGALSGGGRDRK